MPELMFSGQDAFDKHVLDATIFYPSPLDEKKRNEYLCATLVRATLDYDKANQANMLPGLINHFVIETLLHADSYDNIISRTSELLKAKKICGDIAFVLLLMFHGVVDCGGEPSLRKAVYLLSRVYAEHGNGLPSSEKRLRDIWSEYKNVAHYCLVTKNSPIHESLYVQVSFAESIRKFFEKTVPPRTNMPLLDSSLTWKSPLEFVTPGMGDKLFVAYVEGIRSMKEAPALGRWLDGYLIREVREKQST